MWEEQATVWLKVSTLSLWAMFSVSVDLETLTHPPYSYPAAWEVPMGWARRLQGRVMMMQHKATFLPQNPGCIPCLHPRHHSPGAFLKPLSPHSLTQTWKVGGWMPTLSHLVPRLVVFLFSERLSFCKEILGSFPGLREMMSSIIHGRSCCLMSFLL